MDNRIGTDADGLNDDAERARHQQQRGNYSIYGWRWGRVRPADDLRRQLHRLNLAGATSLGNTLGGVYIGSYVTSTVIGGTTAAARTSSAATPAMA